MYFSPREVPSSNMKSWVVEALELSKRNAVVFLLLGLLAMGLGAIDSSGIALISVFPLILSLGCVVAKSADESLSSLKTIVEVAPRAWARVFIIGLMPTIALVVVTMFMETANPGILSALFNHLEQSQTVSATQSLVSLGIMLVIGASAIAMVLWITSYLWFFWTLIVIGELTIVEAINQSFEGFYINKFVFLPYAISVLSLFPAHFFPMIFIPWLAISTSMMYVSFRDVWLGRKENHPVATHAAEPLLN